MYLHRRSVFKEVNLLVRKNRRGLLFYFFCYQFVMAPISLGGYRLEAVRARRRCSAGQPTRRTPSNRCTRWRNPPPSSGV
jgi:hypothetical protein